MKKVDDLDDAYAERDGTSTWTPNFRLKDERRVSFVPFPFSDERKNIGKKNVLLLNEVVKTKRGENNLHFEKCDVEPIDAPIVKIAQIAFSPDKV